MGIMRRYDAANGRNRIIGCGPIPAVYATVVINSRIEMRFAHQQSSTDPYWQPRILMSHALKSPALRR